MVELLPIERLLLTVALPGVVLCSLVEALVLSRRAGFDWKSMGASLADLALRTVVVLLPLSLATPAVDFVWKHRIATVTLDHWQAFLLLFVGQEFCYYWYHRAAHRVRWFWINHSVHHSPNDLTLAAAYRIGPLGKLTGSTLFYLPLVWIGFPVRVVLAALTLNLLYQFWLHATWIPKLGWLEGVVNTPSAHRVHHAANVEYLDANYGGVLMVFDRMFGTYVRERDDLPCRYGWVKPQTSHNPLVIETAPWIALARDLAGARSLRAVAGHLFGPPGWAPDGRGCTTEDLRRQQASAASVPSAVLAEMVPRP